MAYSGHFVAVNKIQMELKRCRWTIKSMPSNILYISFNMGNLKVVNSVYNSWTHQSAIDVSHTQRYTVPSGQPKMKLIWNKSCSNGNYIYKKNFLKCIIPENFLNCLCKFFILKLWRSSNFRNCKVLFPRFDI